MSSTRTRPSTRLSAWAPRRRDGDKTAAHAGVEALGIFTVSDSLVTGEVTDAQARQIAFTAMMELACRWPSSETRRKRLL